MAHPGGVVLMVVLLTLAVSQSVSAASSKVLTGYPHYLSFTPHDQTRVFNWWDAPLNSHLEANLRLILKKTDRPTGSKLLSSLSRVAITTAQQTSVTQFIYRVPDIFDYFNPNNGVCQAVAVFLIDLASHKQEFATVLNAKPDLAGKSLYYLFQMDAGQRAAGLIAISGVINNDNKRTTLFKFLDNLPKEVQVVPRALEYFTSLDDGAQNNFVDLLKQRDSMTPTQLVNATIANQEPNKQLAYLNLLLFVEVANRMPGFVDNTLTTLDDQLLTAFLQSVAMLTRDDLAAILPTLLSANKSTFEKIVGSFVQLHVSYSRSILSSILNLPDGSLKNVLDRIFVMQAKVLENFIKLLLNSVSASSTDWAPKLRKVVRVSSHQQLEGLVWSIGQYPLNQRRGIVEPLLKSAVRTGRNSALSPLADVPIDLQSGLFDSILLKPVEKILFPGMENAVDLTYQLVDVIISTEKYRADPDDATKRPDYFCRYLNYRPEVITKWFFSSLKFRSEFSKRILARNLSFLHGDFAINSLIPFFHYFGKSETRFGPTYGLKIRLENGVGRFYTFSKNNVIGRNIQDEARVPMRQLCLRKTWMISSAECTSLSINVIYNRWSSASVHFADARRMCRRTLGLDLPTRQVLAAALLDDRCQRYFRHFADSWVQSDENDHQLGRDLKKFLCMGCRVRLIDSDGVKSVDLNGKLTCKTGYALQHPPTPLRPVCLKGYWIMSTLGRCRSDWTSYFNDILYLNLTGGTVAPIAQQDGINDASICNDGAQPFLLNQVPPVQRPHYEYLTRRMLASWGAYAAAWIGGNSYISTESTDYVRQETRKGVYHMVICKATCHPNTHGMAHLEWNTGHVTCLQGFTWRCPTGQKCPREGQPTVYPICQSGKWVNVAECIASLPIPSSYPNYILNFATATAACRPNMYASCKISPCAGGTENNPVKFGISAPVNLPDCHQFAITSFVAAGVKYARSTTEETAATAKSACERNGYYLLSEMHFSATKWSRHLRDAIFGAFTGELWILNAGGDFRTFTRNWSPRQSASSKAHFVCVAYTAVDGSLFLNIDMAVSPERCTSGQKLVVRDGFQACVYEP